jgi:hypothetical protein
MRRAGIAGNYPDAPLTTRPSSSLSSRSRTACAEMAEALAAGLAGAPA